MLSSRFITVPAPAICGPRAQKLFRASSAGAGSPGLPIALDRVLELLRLVAVEVAAEAESFLLELLTAAADQGEQFFQAAGSAERLGLGGERLVKHVQVMVVAQELR